MKLKRFSSEAAGLRLALCAVKAAQGRGEHPPVVEWWGARYEPAEIPSDHPLVTTMTDSFAAVTGSRTPVRGMRMEPTCTFWSIAAEPRR